MLAFGVWLGLVGLRPLAHPVLYLQHSSREASPKAISGRTSYLQVRLAYHPYPHLIPRLCNGERFGPPRGISPASAWTWVAHLVSCLLLTTIATCVARALFRLGFPTAPAVPALTLPHKVTRWLILQKARHQACSNEHSPLTACRRSVSGSFSLPSPGFFSPFPHGTCSLSVVKSI
jgi:hypothetical protein